MKLGDAALEEGRDFDLAYSDNVDAGTATVTAEGKGNYADTASATFAIAPASIAAASVEGLRPATYDGAPQAQSPTVKLGGKTLVAGTDYVVSYRDNVEVGTAIVSVEGRGNYAGSKSATFEIGAPAPGRLRGSKRAFRGTSRLVRPTAFSSWYL